MRTTWPEYRTEARSRPVHPILAEGAEGRYESDIHRCQQGAIGSGLAASASEFRSVGGGRMKGQLPIILGGPPPARLCPPLCIACAEGDHEQALRAEHCTCSCHGKAMPSQAVAA